MIGVGLLVLAILGLLALRQAGVLTNAAVPSPSAGPTAAPVASDDPAIGIHDKDNGNSHVNAGTAVAFPELPPTSGSHWPSPAGPVKAGVYTEKIPFEALIHNLEHGGIVIVYNGLTPDEVTKLNEFVRSTTSTSQYKKVLDAPYSDLSRAKIVITAWDYHLDLQSVDTSSMLKFIRVHYDSKDAPEPGAGW